MPSSAAGCISKVLLGQLGTPGKGKPHPGPLPVGRSVGAASDLLQELPRKDGQTQAQPRKGHVRSLPLGLWGTTSAGWREALPKAARGGAGGKVFLHCYPVGTTCPHLRGTPPPKVIYNNNKNPQN